MEQKHHQAGKKRLHKAVVESITIYDAEVWHLIRIPANVNRLLAKELWSYKTGQEISLTEQAANSVLDSAGRVFWDLLNFSAQCSASLR